MLKPNYAAANHDICLVVRDAFHKMLNGGARRVSHYFRNLYRIFHFINAQGFEKEQEKMYSGILRAQLSQGELLSIFYNGLHEDGAKFKLLIEKFALFDNLDLVALPVPDQLIPLYKKEAYGSQDLSEKPKKVI